MILHWHVCFSFERALENDKKGIKFDDSKHKSVENLL